MQPTKIPRKAVCAFGALAVLAVAACSSGSSTTSSPASSTASTGSSTSSAAASSKMGTQPLVVETAELSPLTKNFNPLSATASTGWNLHATDLIYEPLFLFNLMQPTQAPVPMLATNSSWSADGKTLTLTTRSGVKWSDGQAFSAADVAFTFNLIKKYAATADVNGTPVPTSATATGPNTVVLTFPSPEAGNMYAVGSQQIVAQHVWQSVGDPSKYADANPVGTGPYTVSGFTPQKVTLKYNPQYWNVSSIHVPEVIFPGFATGTSPAAVESGEVDWASNDIPNVQNVFVAKNPSTNHVWVSAAPYMAANNVVTMLFNTTKAPFNDPKVRQATSYAINRQQLATQGESGYEAPATSSSGLLLPAGQSLLSSQYANDLPAAGDTAKAASILTSDGWTKSGGKWTKNGQTLKFTLIDPSNFTDYYSDIQLIAKQLNAQGFDVTAQGTAGGYAPWNTEVRTATSTRRSTGRPAPSRTQPSSSGWTQPPLRRSARPRQATGAGSRTQRRRPRWASSRPRPAPPPSRPQWARWSRSCPTRYLRRHCFTARSGPSGPQRTTPAGPARPMPTTTPVRPTTRMSRL